MEKKPQRPMMGMLGCDREVFSRVWKRAGPHNEAASPIQVLPLLPSPPVPPGNAAPSPAPHAADTVGNDDLRPNDVPCFGNDGADHGQFLQDCIRKELENWRAYQLLSTRAGGSAARTLASMAADERRHARRLSGAYFLISGIRFFPQIPPFRPTGSSFWGALRQWFWTEQRVSAAYTAAAEETGDPCLAELYRELAAEEAAHADLLRALVEQMPAN